MTTELRTRHQAAQLYVQALTTAWRAGVAFQEPAVWLARDPEIEEKMLRDADIAHAVSFRRAAIAGRQWQLIADPPKSERAPLAVAVGTALVGRIKKFTESRSLLARAFFSGSRFAYIHGRSEKLTIGDGVERTWWVPVKLEDMDKRFFRPVPEFEEGRACWERWDIQKSDWVQQDKIDALHTIRHTFQDDQSSLFYGRGLREALGWWWYAKTNVFNETLQAIERFAQGIITAKVSGVRDTEGLPNEELIRQWRDVLTDLRSRNVLVFDKEDEVEMVTMPSEGWQLLGEMRSELRSTIFTLVLGANLPTAADKGGSYALAEVQEGSTETLVQADREALEEVLSDRLMACIWWRNYANLRELGIYGERPKFSIVQEKRQDPAERADVAERLNRMGVDLSAEELYEQTGFSKPEPGEPIIKGSEQMPAGFPLGPGAGGFGGV